MSNSDDFFCAWIDDNNVQTASSIVQPGRHHTVTTASSTDTQITNDTSFSPAAITVSQQHHQQTPRSTSFDPAAITVSQRHHQPTPRSPTIHCSARPPSQCHNGIINRHLDHQRYIVQPSTVTQQPFRMFTSQLLSAFIKPPLCLSVCLSVCCQNAKKCDFLKKLSNLELWSLLTTYRKSYMGFSKNP